MDTRKNRLAVPTINVLSISIKNIIFPKKISIFRAEIICILHGQGFVTLCLRRKIYKNVTRHS